MGHNLSTIGGRTAMMYAGDPPWHGLGTRLDKPATATEAIRAASLDWQVGKMPLFIHAGRSYKRVPHRHGIVRFDVGGGPVLPVFGIVGDGYQPLQNERAFGWFDSIVGEEAAIYHTAGALGEGERVWILAKLPEQIRVCGDDMVDKFLLLSNSHDGESSVQLKFTPIRVVCQNTLMMALSKGENVRVNHTALLEERLELAKHNLGIIQRRFTAIEAGFRGMVNVAMVGSRLDEYLRAVFPEPPDKTDAKANRRVLNLRGRAKALFETGEGNGLPKVRGTLWAAYNGVTELIDHHLQGRTPEGRLESIWFGSGATVKSRAYDLAVTMGKNWRN